MPIVIPTADEVARMDARQRAQFSRRIPATRERITESLVRLGCREPGIFPTGRDLAEVRRMSRRFDAALEVDRARVLHATTGADPDAAAHVAALLAAIA